MSKKIIFVFCLSLLFVGNVWGSWQINKSSFKKEKPRTGFLVIAPDRGFVGNNETESIFQRFNKEYLAKIVYVGRKYDGLNSNYSEYIQEALTGFDAISVSNIVVLPLFLSKYNHILKEIRKNIYAYQFRGKININETISESYLSAQILLDHVKKLSKNPSQEKIVILGRGALDEKSENLMKKELEKLSDYIKKRHTFKSIQTGIYYSYNSKEQLRELKDKEVDDMVIHTAAKKGKTLVIPFFIGPKYSNMMSLTHFFDRKFIDIDLMHNSDEVLLHPNFLHWMKKTANKYLPISSDEIIGVVIMPHGATKPYNDAVEKTIEPLKSKFKVEMAYGMGDAVTIQNAISKLENQGIKKIVFVRMYPTSSQLKEKTDYILGLSNKIPEQWDGLIPPQIRNSAIINTFGGYEEDSLIAGIFLERIKEFSKKPEEETIILLAHGGSNDQAEIIRKKRMKKHIDWVQKQFSHPFKKITGLALREDWPEKRENALSKIKNIINEGNKEGKVIIISNRLYGTGPYKHFLKGLNYEMNSKGLAPHPNLTKWLEKGIQLAIKNNFLIKNIVDVSNLAPIPPSKVTLVSD
jgi:sirohydrochlorin ferrochelatase